MKNAKVSKKSLEWISEKLKKFKSDISSGAIETELRDFASKWSTLKQISTDLDQKLSFQDDCDDDIEMEEEECEENLEFDRPDICVKAKKKKEPKKACTNCMSCAFYVLYHHNLHLSSYRNLYFVYKYIMTFSCTQVRCEVTFSKLTHVQCRRRNLMKSPKLNAFMMMSTEKEILQNVRNDDIVNEVAKRSNILSRKLLI